MKVKFILISFFLIFSNCKMRSTNSSSTKNVYDGQWMTTYSCENDSVRFDQKTNLYEHEYQLVIKHQDAINRIRKEGGLNEDNINSNGELIISNLKQSGSFYSFVGFVPRDAGHLRYSIDIADTNKKMILSIGYTDGDINNWDVISGHIPGFTGYDFYGCRNVEPEYHGND